MRKWDREVEMGGERESFWAALQATWRLTAICGIAAMELGLAGEDPTRFETTRQLFFRRLDGLELDEAEVQQASMKMKRQLDRIVQDFQFAEDTSLADLLLNESVWTPKNRAVLIMAGGLQLVMESLNVYSTVRFGAEDSD